MASPNRKLTSGSSSADIAATLEQARADLFDAEAAVATAEQKYDAGLVELDKADLRILLDAKVEAQIDVDQIKARIAKLEGQLESASASEAETARIAAYENAKRLTDAASKKLAKDYVEAALRIREVLAAIAEADIAIRAANEDLPEGASRLEGPESVRSRPNLYKQVVSETGVELWAAEGSPYEPLADHLQANVQVRHVARRVRGRYDDGTGDDGGSVVASVVVDSGGVIGAVKRRFIKRVYLPDATGHFAEPLASRIELPAAVAGGKPFWSALDSHPSHVHALACASLPEPEKSAERASMVEYIPVE